MNQRALLGVFMACRAMPGTVNVLDVGVGCKVKTQRQVAAHDRAREAQNVLVWTDVGEGQFIKGSVGHLEGVIRETISRRGNPELIVVSTSAAVELAGADVKAEVRAAQKDAGCPVVYVPAAGFAGDLYQGYADTVGAVMALARWDSGRGEPRTLNVAGYLFDRFENDHAANLFEVRRMLAGAGATFNVGFLSGTPFRALMDAPRASANIFLPYAARLLPRAPKVTWRPAIQCDLPVGRRGSARFLGEVARAAGLPQKKARDFADGEAARTESALRVAREGLAGLRAVVLADTPLSAGLVCLLGEIGVKTVLVGLLDRTLGGARRFRAAVAAGGGVLDNGCRVIEDPSARDVGLAAGALRLGGGRGPFEILMAPDVWLPEEATRGAARVEIGFPCNNRHAIAASPFLGYAGALSVSQRLLDAARGIH
jgi:nitrogenase molybdenum-iron protein alpha/beta subunit